MSLKTPLYDKHIEMGGKMVDFAGWQMPVHFGSQIDEHNSVRQDAGMFDVSHMAVTDLKGSDVRDMLRLLLANNVDKLQEKGKALYSCMLNSDGGILDDLIVYFLADDWFRIVSNAGTREKDIKWIENLAKDFEDLSVIERPDLAIIAVQGPNAKEKTYAALGDAIREQTESLKPFFATTVGDLFIATTGYTGEAGFEIILPGKAAAFTWQMLADKGVKPIGLGARDTLRLEAGMALYGSDMDESSSPLETGLNWTVGWQPDDRNFIGRSSLESQKKAGNMQGLIGIVFKGKGVLRRHQIVSFGEAGEGEITSGGFSPTLNHSIALVKAPFSALASKACQVNLRGRMVDAEVVKYPFVRNGKSCLD
jgi:aminomethyltransferase